MSRNNLNKLLLLRPLIRLNPHLLKLNLQPKSLLLQQKRKSKNLHNNLKRKRSLLRKLHQLKVNQSKKLKNLNKKKRKSCKPPNTTIIRRLKLLSQSLLKLTNKENSKSVLKGFHSKLSKAILKTFSILSETLLA